MTAFRGYALRLLPLFFYLFSLVVTHPLALPESLSEYSLSQEPRAIPDAPKLLERDLALEKRKPKLYSQAEHKALRQAAQKIYDATTPDDLILFVGNSGSYFFPAFDMDARHIVPIPMSKTKTYKTGLASKKLLNGYWDNAFEYMVAGKGFTRIIIVDHSGTGQSVDGFREAILDIVNAAPISSSVKKDFAKRPMALINVIDYSRRDRGPRPTVNPKTVPVLLKFDVGDTNLLNGMVGGVIHPRIQPEYPYTSWNTPIEKAFKSNELKDAKAMVDDIRSYNEKNGGLIGSKGKKTKPSSKTVNPTLLKIMKWMAYT